MADLETRVHDRMDRVIDPCSAAQGYDFSVLEMGLLEDISVEDGHVTVSLRLTSPTCMMVDRFLEQIDEAVTPLDGVESVSLDTDDGLSWAPSMMDEAAMDRRRARLADSRADETAPIED